MFRFLKERSYSNIPIPRFIAKWGPIGVDMSGETLKLVQLESKGKSINLLAGASEKWPDDVKPGSANWQRWAIEAARRLTANGQFKSRDIIAAIPASEVFIDHIKMPKLKDDDDQTLQDALLAGIKHKLPAESDKVMLKYIPTENDNVMVIAVEREKIDRYLAVYEKAQLAIKSICIWPAALANSYARFFGRRKPDIDAVVMLLDMELHCTNVVICRHKNLLFARSIPIGTSHLESAEKIITRMVLELTECKRQFNSMYKRTPIERLIFLSGRVVDKEICTTIAKQLEMPAQIGDCLAAVEFPEPADSSGIDRRGCQINWATAFGLSLS